MTDQHETLPYRHVLTLPAMGSAVRIARETTEQVVTEWGIHRTHRIVGPALLILSELVTNSVRHASALSPNIIVIYAGGPDTFAFAVHDRHPYQPSLLHAHLARRGGLATVVELTLGLGGTAVLRTDADERGKSIWITLPL
ncbi:ATP-binding protein [Streptomyces sp. HNM0645]|uniref:ATP-binding protein n=1 Tax=Streptomyces sp. HNM0645 TaxID=2782343 RepID=UPI0024B68859|nr:ATP-binding protein [Streptomyces sp. HNM0645]MDI9886425.1 ATP-binding protein [Streptomyces sp. HNM0645]